MVVVVVVVVVVGNFKRFIQYFGCCLLSFSQRTELMSNTPISHNHIKMSAHTVIMIIFNQLEMEDH